MVEGATLAERLWWFVENFPDGRGKLKEWAGVSEQSVSNWLNGRKAPTDANLRKIAEKSGENFLDLKYGQEWREAAAREMGSEFPVDPVSQGDARQVFDALPPRYREVWISIGKFLVYRYAPASVANPFPQSFLPLRMGQFK